MMTNAKSETEKRSAGKASKKRVSRKGVPSAAQTRWLQKGLDQPGGKLPLFDDRGREVPGRTIRVCIAEGWAEPWFSNPIKPDWLVCKLTQKGADVLSRKK
ncbi:hypothetical protein [Roseibium sp.]|uniref:hypothetical protein n=1 Tax=Roseibium sp. TaxID=1936156 RepID=UPI003A97F83F